MFALEKASCGEDADRDRQIEASTTLAQLGRGEIDGDSAIRENQAGGGDCASNPGHALADRCFRQTDDIDARKLRGDPDFDLDRRSRDPDDGGTPYARDVRRGRGARG
jgi:hypothetical protein